MLFIIDIYYLKIMALHFIKLSINPGFVIPTKEGSEVLIRYCALNLQFLYFALDDKFFQLANMFIDRYITKL